MLYDSEFADFLLTEYDNSLDSDNITEAIDTEAIDTEPIDYEEYESYIRDREVKICNAFKELFEMDVAIDFVMYMLVGQRDYFQSIKYIKNFDKYMYKYNKLTSEAQKIGITITQPPLNKPASIVSDMVSEAVARGCTEIDAIRGVSKLLEVDIEKQHKDWRKEIKSQSRSKKKNHSKNYHKALENDLRWHGKI